MVPPVFRDLQEQLLHLQLQEEEQEHEQEQQKQQDLASSFGAKPSTQTSIPRATTTMTLKLKAGTVDPVVVANLFWNHTMEIHTGLVPLACGTVSPLPHRQEINLSMMESSQCRALSHGSVSKLRESLLEATIPAHLPS